MPGWWTPAATIAAATGTFFSTSLDPQANPNLVSSAYYAPLPTQFEEMSVEDRDERRDVPGSGAHRERPHL